MQGTLGAARGFLGGNQAKEHTTMSDIRSMDESSGRHGDVARRETAALISSERVSGTDVYDAGGEKLGTIHSVMIDKAGGQVAYAVLQFGGWFGVGSQYFPVPWSQLTYSPQHEGYVVGVTEQQLKAAPQYAHDSEAMWDDMDWRSRVDTHYGLAGRGTAPIG